MVIRKLFIAWCSIGISTDIKRHMNWTVQTRTCFARLWKWQTKVCIIVDIQNRSRTSRFLREDCWQEVICGLEFHLERQILDPSHSAPTLAEPRGLVPFFASESWELTIFQPLPWDYCVHGLDVVPLPMWACWLGRRRKAFKHPFLRRRPEGLDRPWIFSVYHELKLFARSELLTSISL